MYGFLYYYNNTQIDIDEMHTHSAFSLAYAVDKLIMRFVHNTLCGMCVPIMQMCTHIDIHAVHACMYVCICVYNVSLVTLVIWSLHSPCSYIFLASYIMTCESQF